MFRSLTVSFASYQSHKKEIVLRVVCGLFWSDQECYVPLNSSENSSHEITTILLVRIALFPME